MREIKTLKDLGDPEVIERGQRRDDTVYLEAVLREDLPGHALSHYAMAILVLTDEQWELVREAVRAT